MVDYSEVGPRHRILLLPSRLLFTNRQWLCKPGTLTRNAQTTMVPGVAGDAQVLLPSLPILAAHFLRVGIHGGKAKISSCRQEIPPEFS